MSLLCLCGTTVLYVRKCIGGIPNESVLGNPCLLRVERRGRSGGGGGVNGSYMGDAVVGYGGGGGPDGYICVIGAICSALLSPTLTRPPSLHRVVSLLYTEIIHSPMLREPRAVKFHAQVRREIKRTREEGKNPYPVVQCLALKEDLLAA